MPYASPDRQRDYNRTRSTARSVDPVRRAKQAAFIEKYRKSPRGKEGILKAQLMRHYGLTLGQYYTMLGEQNGLCRICKQLCSTGHRLAVDHIHVDGYEDLPSDEKARLVRGLLCADCNRALGMFQDSPDLLKAAAQYLEENAPLAGGAL